MSLFDKLKNSNYSLKGQQGPNFENEGQRSTSNIQALVSNNTLISSQDLSKSNLDLNNKTPLKYVDNLGSSNDGNVSTFNSTTGTGLTLDKRLKFSQLGMGGQPGPNFENVSQKTISDIQALAKNNALISSQDLLTGRIYGKGRFTVFVPSSTLDNNGMPVGNVYKNKGPKEGRY